MHAGCEISGWMDEWGIFCVYAGDEKSRTQDGKKPVRPVRRKNQQVASREVYWIDGVICRVEDSLGDERGGGGECVCGEQYVQRECVMQGVLLVVHHVPTLCISIVWFLPSLF